MDTLQGGLSEFSTGLPATTKSPVEPAPLAERVIEAMILIVILVVAVSGNTLLWVVVLRHRSLKTESNALVLCLSAADLLVSVVSMPITTVTVVVGRWIFSDTLCIALGFISMCTFIGSVMSLAAISINRYVLIVHPSKFKRIYTKRNTGYFIFGVWCLAALLGLPPLTRGWGEYGFLPNQSFCFCSWRTNIYYTFFMVGVCFGGPCSVMTFCYVNILRVVRQSRKRVASNPACMQKRPKPLESPAPSFAANGTPPRKSSQESNQMPESNAREKLRSQLNELLRAQTIAMAHNDLSGSGQFDAPDTSEPKSVQDAVCESAESTPEKQLNSGSGPTREIKWIVPRKGSKATIASDDGDRNSNDTRKDRGKGRCVSPNERSALTRHKTRKKNRSESERRRKEEELKLTKSFLVVIFVFIICWLPFCITMFWSVFSEEDDAVPRPVDMGSLLLGYLNSCCNPIIYGVMNKRFRAGYKNILCGWRRKKESSSNNQASGMHLNTSTMGSLG
ncbi:alpha-2B adrenergic receptor-like [Diadema setosum]|uniref:alpha-2B adrenergic receptor-like n=1 Tax=Diadema setosum TaxID=31175 RepID=UPI003B3A1B26